MQKQVPPPVPEAIYQALADFLANRPTTVSLDAIKVYLITYWDTKEVKELLSNYWLTNTLFEKKLEEEKQAADRLLQEIHLRKRLQKRRQLLISGRWLVAATLLLAVGVGVLWYGTTRKSAPLISSQANLQPEQQQQLEVDSYIEVLTTPYGKRASLRLKDGSEVELNAGSKLELAHNFGNKNRKVRLSGEAFFKVKPDANQPFIVLTQQQQVKVIGTSFNVKAYTTDSRENVAVETGVVEVSSLPSHQKIVLQKGWASQQFHSTGQLARTSVAYQQAAPWRNGILEFDHASLQEVALQLERWYGITLKLKDPSAATCTYSGRFDRKPLQKVLDELSFTGGFIYTIHQGSYLIEGITCR